MIAPTYAEVVASFEKWIIFEYGEGRLETHSGCLGLYVDFDIMGMFSGYIEAFYKAYEIYHTELES